MATMAERYGTGNRNSYKGFGVPIKKKKKVQQLPADSKISTMPAKTGEAGAIKQPEVKRKPSPGRSFSIRPVNPIAKKKRSNLGGSMRSY